MARKNTVTAPKTTTDTSARRKTVASRKSNAPSPTTETAAVAVVAPVIDIAPAPVAAPVTRTIARAELDVAVRREAYQLAERRGFRNGNPFEDWITAEAAVQARLAADGVTVA